MPLKPIAGFIASMLVTTLVLGANAPSSRAQTAEEGYAALLEKYVSPSPGGVNFVDYAAWQSDAAGREALSAYLAFLQQQTPSAMTRDEAYVFWINLYNAATLNVILENYPVASIRDIKSEGTSLLDFKAFFGPWRTRLVTVEGKPLSLDDIEHNILRPQFRDPRSHYALNCASLGCPNLKLTPWTVETLEADLEDAARAFINHPRGVTAGPDGALEVSSIYIWFQEDFGAGEADVIAHLRRYAEPELAGRLEGRVRIAADRYDWALNDRRSGNPVR